MKSLGRVVLAAVCCLALAPMVRADVRITGIVNPHVWTDALIDRVDREGADVLVELVTAYGSSEIQAQASMAGLAPHIDDFDITERHYMSDTMYGDGMRQIIVATYWESGTPFFFRFMFMRNGQDWMAIKFAVHSQLDLLEVYTGPGGTPTPQP